MAIKVNFDRDSEKYKVVMGVDSSSQGVAWTVLNGDQYVDCGKINLTKIKSMPDMLKELSTSFPALMAIYEPDIVVIEKSIFVKNPGTARTLSYIVGSVMTLAIEHGSEAHDVEPATWKSWLGYKNLRKGFVDDAKEAIGKGHKKFCDGLRKSQTWNIIKHNYPVAGTTVANDDHDIADSWGVALWGVDHFGKALVLNTSHDIAVNKLELEELGLHL